MLVRLKADRSVVTWMSIEHLEGLWHRWEPV